MKLKNEEWEEGFSGAWGPRTSREKMKGGEAMKHVPRTLAGVFIFIFFCLLMDKKKLGWFLGCCFNLYFMAENFIFQQFLYIFYLFLQNKRNTNKNSN